LSLEDAERIVWALKARGLIEAAVVRAGPGAEDFTAFLLCFWNYERSPYVRVKLVSPLDPQPDDHEEFFEH
jgi:hypothetical protein